MLVVESLAHDLDATCIHGDLRWLGIEWDVGVEVGGPTGPYRQSERLETYREHIDRLLAEESDAAAPRAEAQLTLARLDGDEGRPAEACLRLREALDGARSLDHAVEAMLAEGATEIVARRPDMTAYYQVRSQDGFWRAVWESGVDLFSWEFLWRGFMLFGLKEKFGYYSVLIQMIPFVILHNGKPAPEIISVIIGDIEQGILNFISN